MMANIALTFAVLDIDGRAIAIGMVLAAHTIPMIVLLLWGGVIVRPFPPRRGPAGLQRRLRALARAPSPVSC